MEVVVCFIPQLRQRAKQVLRDSPSRTKQLASLYWIFGDGRFLILLAMPHVEGVAEFIVASALGVECDVREEWAAYDLQTSNGIKVEVKSAAYMQSWAQKEHSKIHFACPATLLWESETNKQSSERKRWADAYVFALLHHRERDSLNPLKLEQWEFYVLPVEDLNQRTRSQHSISLTSLQKMSRPLNYYELSRDFHSLISLPPK